MIAFLLNLPFTIIGLLVAAMSVPIRFKCLSNKPTAFVVSVRSFWWAIGYASKARAATIGHVVLLGPLAVSGDREHELIHVEQYARVPFIHPFLYAIELLRVGYRNNKYEVEAYERAGNVYSGEETLTRG